MKSKTDAVVLGSDQRCWRTYLFNAASFFVYWFLTLLVFVGLTLAASVTRFAPGAALPEFRLTLLVVPDPRDAGGTPLILRAGELAQFRAAHPGAKLALAPGATTVLEPDKPRRGNSYRAEYTVRELGDGRIETTVRGATPYADSLGSFGYAVLRYHVIGERVEPIVMLRFDPFLTWFGGTVLSFFAALALCRGLELWLIDRPLTRGRWRMSPPLNRDWVVTRGVPLRFDHAPASLDALAAALRDAGATLRYEAEQGALHAHFGSRARLKVNLRCAKKQAAPTLDALIEGGNTPFATLLVVLVAPLAGLIAVAMTLDWMLDPFAVWGGRSAWIAGFGALAGVSAYVGLRWLRRPDLIDEADRLATILFDTLTAQGACSVPPPKWPRLAPPLPKWRRRLQLVFIGAMVLLALGPILLAVILSLR